MRILSIDTSTKFLCLGISDNNKLYECNLDLGVRHSTLIIPTIKRALDALGWSIGDIDYFACGIGPGSFTGIRVGVAAIKGLAWPFKKPIIGISSLDILSRNALPCKKTVVPLVDARRNLVYCSIYRAKGKALKKIAPYMLLSIEELFKKIKGEAVLLGDAAALYREKLLLSLPQADILDKDYWYPKGRNIIPLALEKIKAKELGSVFDIKPIYLYPKDCQIRIKK